MGGRLFRESQIFRNEHSQKQKRWQRRVWLETRCLGHPSCYSIHRHPPLQAPTPVADTFLQYRTSKVRVLRAAQLERLVHELVSGDREQDPGFVPAFLATHQAFVPTARVLGFLLPPPPPPPPPGSVILRRLSGLHFRTPSPPPQPADLEPQSTDFKSSITSFPSDRGFSSQGRQQEGRGTGSELQQESAVGSTPTAPHPHAWPKGASGKGPQGQDCQLWLRGWESLGPWTQF